MAIFEVLSCLATDILSLLQVLDRSIPAKPPRALKYPLDVEKLQFLAKFHPADGKQLQKVDAVRRFRLYVYPEDGTVAIYENKIENSGLSSGKFLERQPIYRNLRMRQVSNALSFFRAVLS